MKREKLTLAIFVLLVVLLWILSTSFLMFSVLFFFATILLTLYLSHKYVGHTDYKSILNEIKEEYKENILRFLSFEKFMLKISSILSSFSKSTKEGIKKSNSDKKGSK